MEERCHTCNTPLQSYHHLNPIDNHGVRTISILLNEQAGRITAPQRKRNTINTETVGEFQPGTLPHLIQSLKEYARDHPNIDFTVTRKLKSDDFKHVQNTISNIDSSTENKNYCPICEDLSATIDHLQFH